MIEGDNFHSLTCLNYTHKNKVDLIYIDPPYNTGNTFRYKDKRYIEKDPDGKKVDENSPLRHSYWLSFMYKRLLLSKNLLKDGGKLIISIDDNEMANLVLLCNMIFGSENQIAILPVIPNLGGRSDKIHFAICHEYAVVFAKNKSKCTFNQFELSEQDRIEKKWEKDNEKGWWKVGVTLKKGGGADTREERPNMYYPILVNRETEQIAFITDDEHKKIYDKENKIFNDAYVEELKKDYEHRGFAFILPTTNKNNSGGGIWRKGIKTAKKDIDDLVVKKLENGVYGIHPKQRPILKKDLHSLPSEKPKTLFYKPSYATASATTSLKRILGNNTFPHPKSVELIKDFIKLSIKKSQSNIVLDFFAGSGTTLHSILELNNQGYSIQGILCTNNENEICRKVTYPRITKVIKGYKYREKGKEKEVEGLGGSLLYFKTDFVGNNSIHQVTDNDLYELSLNAGYLLAIKENTLIEIDSLDNYYQIFKSRHKITVIYFNEDFKKWGELKASLTRFFEDSTKEIVLYLFNWSNQFERIHLTDIPKKIKIKSIPQPIRNIYEKIVLTTS